jgi:hypothetical protein
MQIAILILHSSGVEEVAEWSPPQNHPRQSENFGSEGQMTGGSSGSGRFFQTTNSLIAPTVASNQTPFDRQIANSWQQFPSEHGHMVTHNSRRGPTLGGPSGFVPHPGGLTGSIGQIGKQPPQGSLFIELL